jgi:DNA-binding response OmpR family regulator
MLSTISGPFVLHRFDLNDAEDSLYREDRLVRYPILVVDDDPQIRNLLVRFLDPWRFNVMAAADADEALCILSAFAPQFILLDLHLSHVPNADGIALLQELRETGYKNPIYILSGDTSFEQANLAVKNGANGYLVKNCSEHFWRRLDIILNYYNLGTYTPQYENLSVAAEAYLETSGLTAWDLQLLNEFVEEYAREKEISRILNRSPVAIRKEFQRIRDHLHARSQAELGRMMGVLGCFKD